MSCRMIICWPFSCTRRKSYLWAVNLWVLLFRNLSYLAVYFYAYSCFIVLAYIDVHYVYHLRHVVLSRHCRNWFVQSFTGPWNTLLDETKRFLELKFSSIPSEFFLLSLYICILLYCRKAKLKVESISQYPCGNAKMGQRWNFCWAVREKSSENFQIFLILSLWE